MRPGSSLRQGNKIVFVGEAYGEQEDKLKLPFVGSSGSELRRMIASAGIDSSICGFTNVFNLRPLANNVELLCEKGRREATAPPFSVSLTKGLYLHPDYWPQVVGLYGDLAEINPTLVVPLGNTALWALTQASAKISRVRGTLARSPLGWKLLPTYHPAAVIRAWDLQPIVVADLMKAGRSFGDTNITRPERSVLVEPTLEELHEYFISKIFPAKRLSLDIETRRFGSSYQITCVGIAVSRSDAIVVPFVRGNKSYWPTLEEELRAWWIVRASFNSNVPKILQNHFFDSYVMWRVLRMRTTNPVFDTLLSHHALYPELEKSLAFQGSIYTEEPAWKLDRPRGHKSNKGDEE